MGNTLSTSSTEHALLDSAITDLNIKTNNLHLNFHLVSPLHCLDIISVILYKCLWKLIMEVNNYHNNIERFCVSWRKVIRRIWKIPYRTHNALVHLINKCNSIVNILVLEKQCIKFL